MEISAPNPLGLSGKNLIINGSFRINQRGYASGGALPANGYGHDRWRDNTGNAGGTSYTFTQASQADFGVSHSPDTSITIAAGGALTQLVEASNFAGQPVTLSWTGTSQATISFYNNGGVIALYNSATSPVTVMTPPGDTLYVSFGPGTLGLVQLEAGTTPTPFERRHPATELALCQRYYELLGTGLSGQATSSTGVAFALRYAVPKRAAPTLSLLNTAPQILQPGIQYATASGAAMSVQTVSDTQGCAIIISGFSGLSVNAPAYLNNSNVIAVAAEL